MNTRNKRTEQTRRMVVAGMLSAITAVLTFTPIGMIPLPPPMPNVTMVHIPVLVAALVEGPVVGVIVGLVFGLCSLIRAWGTGMVGLTLFFRNPLISVLPRMLVPLAAYGFYVLIRKATGPKLGAALSAAVGAIANTVLCLGLIALIYGADLTVMINEMIAAGNAGSDYLNNAGAWLVTAVGLPNGIAEMLVAAIIVPMIKTAVDAVSHRARLRKH